MNFSTSMQWQRTALLIIGFILTIHPLSAQKEYDFLGKGARAAGMAYAFNAIADDATAMSWNPAGMVQVKKPEFAFVNSLDATNNNFVFADDNKYKPQYTIDYIGIVYPLKFINKDLVFGISYQNNINYKSAYSTVVDTFLGYSNSKNKVTVNALSAGAAFSLTHYLGLGFSYHQWFSLGNTANNYWYYNSKNINDEKYEHNENILEMLENFKYSGCNYAVGLFFDFASFKLPMRLALKVESKFALKNDYSYQYRDDYIFKEDSVVTYYEESAGIEKYFFPVMLNTGISYRPDDYLTFAIDFDYRPFKDKKYTYDSRYYKIRMDNTQTDTMVSGVYYDIYNLLKSNADLNQFRFGAEYIIHPKFALIPVRIGWKNNPTSISDHVSHEQVFAHSLNFGTGLVTRRFSFDLAYERYRYKRKFIFAEEPYDEEKIFHYFIFSIILSLF